MTDAISRSAVLKFLGNLRTLKQNNLQLYSAELIDGIMKRVEKLPAVDTVPVVRCKDCKHWGATDYAIAETEHVKCCEYANYMVSANGYCVYGEVKNND